jgi:tetratricopeptide (TPR) repeat protein
MRRPLYSIVLFIAIFLLASCANRKTAATLNDVETYIQARPDSALATIRAIDTTTLTTRALRAHYALLHAMALDKNWIDTTDVGVVMPAVEYYERHPSDLRCAKAWYYLGRIQENSNNLPKAIISFSKANQYLEVSPNPSFQALVYQAISTVYCKNHFHDEALHYTELAYSSFLLAGDTLKANGSLYRMAQDLNNIGRYAESDSLYRLLIYEKEVHPNLRSSLLSNYALNLINHSEEYQHAVSLFEEVISTYGSLQRNNFWGAYAFALSRIGKEQRADQIFKQLHDREESSAFVYSSWKSLADACSGNYTSAYILQKRASEIQTDNVVKVLKQSTVKSQKDYYEKLQAETEQLARQRKQTAWISCLLLLFIMVALFLFYRRRTEQIEQEKESLLETFRGEVSKLEKDKNAVREQYIQMCKSQFGHLGYINEILLYHNTESDNNLYKEIKKALRKSGLDVQNQEAFEKMLNNTFDNVMIHFREAFPQKSEQYYQLVGFLFAGFDAATICAIIQGLKKHNVYVEKHRLKQAFLTINGPYKKQFFDLLP